MLCRWILITPELYSREFRSEKFEYHAVKLDCRSGQCAWITIQPWLGATWTGAWPAVCPSLDLGANVLGHRRLDGGCSAPNSNFLSLSSAAYRRNSTSFSFLPLFSSLPYLRTYVSSRAYNVNGDGIIALISPLLFAADSLDERHPQSTRPIVIPIICLSAAAKMQGEASTIILFFGFLSILLSDELTL